MVNKLILGTVQFGLKYGINNFKGKPDIKTVFEILSFANDNGIKYDINSLKLGVRLTNMNINGISKGSHTKNGATKIFNISELKKTLKIGCIIDV